MNKYSYVVYQILTNGKMYSILMLLLKLPYQKKVTHHNKNINNKKMIKNSIMEKQSKTIRLIKINKHKKTERN